MGKLYVIAIVAAFVVIGAGHSSYLNPKDSEPNTKQDTGKQLPGTADRKEGKKEKNAAGSDDRDTLNLEDRDFDIEEKENKRLEEELEKDRNEYATLSSKKDTFSFHVGFSIGGMGYGIVGGPRNTSHDFYKFRFPNGAFHFGFRGGVEAMFYINRDHILSLGIFYEQRKPELKINYVLLTGIIFSIDPFVLLYTPGSRFVSKSVIDLKYLNIPVTYRYHINEEFYIGIGFDIAPLLQAEADFSMGFLKSQVNLKKRLLPVDFGGRAVVGFILNRVFIEIAVGAGILKFDTMYGDRRSMYFTAMIGYRI